MEPGRDAQVAVVDRDFVGKPAENGVEAEEILQARRVGEIGDRADADVRAVVEDSKEVAADAAEPEEADPGDHAGRNYHTGTKGIGRSIP